jgi:hypothetical protein
MVIMVCAAISDSDDFNRRRILPEEIRRNRVPPPEFDGSFRWFMSPNVVDLWRYRSPAEKRRIIAFMRRRRWAAYR